MFYKKFYVIVLDQGFILFLLMELVVIFYDFDMFNVLEMCLKGDFVVGSIVIFKGDMLCYSLLWSENEVINWLVENVSDMLDKLDGFDMICCIQGYDWLECIKVGYVLDDFIDYSLVMNFICGVFMVYDVDCFDIYLIDVMLLERVGFNNCSCYGMIILIYDFDVIVVVCVIFNVGIDILVDLKGYIGGVCFGIFNQLVVFIQVFWFGFFGMFVNFDIDYIIGDCVVLLDSFKLYYIEKFCCMLESFMLNDLVCWLLLELCVCCDLVLLESKFVFFVFMLLDKIFLEVFGFWILIMKKVLDSVFWMVEILMLVCQNLICFVLLQGVMLNCLIFVLNVFYEDYFVCIQVVDFVFDIFFYNG